MRVAAREKDLRYISFVMPLRQRCLDVQYTYFFNVRVGNFLKYEMSVESDETIYKQTSYYIFQPFPLPD